MTSYKNSVTLLVIFYKPNFTF